MNAEQMRAYRHRVATEGPGKVDATGSQRRVRALMRIGWRSSDIAERAGWRDRSVPRGVLAKGTVYRTTADRIAEVYDDLCDQRGPSDCTRRRAERAGWQYPTQWPADRIDDPEALPLPTRAVRSATKGRGREGVDLGEVLHLLSYGTPTTEIAARMHVQAQSITTAVLKRGDDEAKAKWRRARELEMATA